MAEALLGLFCNFSCFHLCPHITLNSSSKLNILEWSVYMTAVQVFVGSALTLSFGVASRDYTFDRSALYVAYFFKRFTV